MGRVAPGHPTRFDEPEFLTDMIQGLGEICQELNASDGLLRLINDVADEKEWSMVSGHLRVGSRVMVRQAGTSKDADAWLRRQLEGLGR